MRYCFIAAILLILISCAHAKKQSGSVDTPLNSIANRPASNSVDSIFIQTKNIAPQQVVKYAKTLLGIPYKFGSADPRYGFDCSGFITYVFQHFNLDVPRSSIDFTNVYHEIPLKNAKQSDLILFTGTDTTNKAVGHMGIIVANVNDSISFIHSTSGKANGVAITPLNSYYMSRFVKIIRIFPQNN